MCVIDFIHKIHSTTEPLYEEFFGNTWMILLFCVAESAGKIIIGDSCVR